MVILLVTGPHGVGKTSYLRRLYYTLVDRGFSAYGVVERPFVVKDRRTAYYLELLPYNTLIPVAKRRGYTGGLGDFEFLEEGFKRALKMLNSVKAQCIILDEIGRLELQGRGLWPLFEWFTTKNRPDYLILGVQSRILVMLTKRLLRLSLKDFIVV